MESIMSSKLFTTRRGTIILGVSAAVLAAIALLIYLNQYRNSVNSGTQPLQVLVAKSLIQKGTPGDVIASTSLYQVGSIPRSQVKSGAFVDPKTLAGQVATADIFPGQQLTASDFATGAAGSSVLQSLSKNQRAVVVPLDSPTSVGGQLVAGDRVDVYVAFTQAATNGVAKPIVRDALQNIRVLTAGTGGNITLEATPIQAGELIFASQNAKIWLVLRPAIGSTTTKPPLITANDLLTTLQIGSKP